MNKGKHVLLKKDLINKKGLCAHCGDVSIVKSGGYYKCIVAKRESKKKLNGYVGKVVLPENVKCEICKNNTATCVDHNHTTGLFRGFLCRNCNLGIGFLKDDILIVESSVEYLKK